MARPLACPVGRQWAAVYLLFLAVGAGFVAGDYDNLNMPPDTPAPDYPDYPFPPDMPPPNLPPALPPDSPYSPYSDDNSSSVAPAVEIVAFDTPANAILALADSAGLTTYRAAMKLGGSAYDYLSNGSIEATYLLSNDMAINVGLALLNISLSNALLNPLLFEDVLLYNTISEVTTATSLVNSQQLRTNYIIPGSGKSPSILTFLGVKIGNLGSISFKCVPAAPYKCRLQPPGKIVSGGIVAGNSIIYIIDAFVPPPGWAAPAAPVRQALAKAKSGAKSPPPSGYNYPDILTALTKQPTLSEFYNSLQAAGLATPIANMPYNCTAFIPTNDAMNALLAQMEISFSAFKANVPLMNAILQNHFVVQELLHEADLTDGLFMAAMNTRQLVVAVPSEGVVQIVASESSANITRFDITVGTHGQPYFATIHVIDAVLLTKPFIGVQP